MSNLVSTKPKRNMGADIIRCFAFFAVVAVHFFWHSGFYSTVVEGKEMLLMTIMRSFFIICVPLFMILSGYLSGKQSPNFAYFKKIGKTYITYIFCSLCCVAYRIFFLEQQTEIKTVIFSILNFTAAPYSWYVEMYLGLFFLIPFLNILYANINTKKEKRTLIFVLILLTCLPAVVNIYSLYSFEWIKQPSLLSSYNELIPNWWEGCYPLTYYFIGCYIKEYGLKIPKILNIILIFLTLGVSGLFVYWRSYKAYFILGSWAEYNSIFNVILTTLVFSFFININYEKTPKFVTKLFKNISGLCFGAYLVSWIFDSYFYEIFNERIPEFTNRLEYSWLIVAVVFISSLVLSFVVSRIQYLLEWIVGKIVKLFGKKETVQ